MFKDVVEAVEIDPVGVKSIVVGLSRQLCRISSTICGIAVKNIMDDIQVKMAYRYSLALHSALFTIRQFIR